MSSGAPVRVAVVGAGRMGGNHARVLDAMPGATLAGIFDASPEAASAVAAQYGVPVFSDLAEVASQSDAAVVAVSSSAHAAIGTALLERGLPCLVEKPFATTREECARLIAAAQKSGVRLAVGHVERFNPAVAAAQAARDGAEILAIEGRRLNPGSTRILDVDVVMDLMLHDIDAVLHFMGTAPVSVAAQGVALAQANLADHASAMLTFPGGAIATLTASRASETRVRELTLFCRDRTVILDFLRQELRVARGGEETAVAVEKAQPLMRELDAFLAGLRSADSSVGVSAEESLRTLEIVWALQERLKKK